MNVTEQFVNDLADLIKRVWPDVLDPVFRMTQMERRNWLDDIGNGQLTAPYCVVDIPQKIKSENGSLSSMTWDVTPTIYYITAEKAGAGLIADLIEARLESLSDGLMFPADGGLTFPYTVYEYPEWMTGASQSVNAAMLEKQLPFLSGSLTFTAMVGWVRTR